MRFHKTEQYGFQRNFFPYSFRGHYLWLLENDVYYMLDDRLQVHIVLHCSNCQEDCSVRGRLMPENSNDPDYTAALAKFLAFAAFRNKCGASGTTTKTFI